ncbi:MAG TPA: helix-turn-helix domain-containing protein [Firmicutes bacterium]|nr:helix-turn-helix domain-containing protein [Bacillota bacterium]
MIDKKAAKIPVAKMAGKKKIDVFWKETMKSKEAQEGYAQAEALFEFVEQLQKTMKRKHLSYYAVAKRAGIKHQVLARILNGAENAEVSTLSKIASGVGEKLHLGLAKR